MADCKNCITTTTLILAENFITNTLVILAIIISDFLKDKIAIITD